MNDIASHLPIVERIARSLRRRLPPQVHLEEMVAAGSLGLVEAAARFDAKRGVSFEGYAGMRVRGAMLDTLRTGCSSTRGARRRARKVETCRAMLSTRLGRPPEREEMEAVLGPDAAHLDESSTFRLVSLDHQGGGGGGEPMAAEIEDECPSVFDVMVRNETKQSLLEAMGLLNERHRRVLSLCYFEEHSLKEAGRSMGVTESRACQLRREALRRLRSILMDSD